MLPQTRGVTTFRASLSMADYTAKWRHSVRDIAVFLTRWSELDLAGLCCGCLDSFS